MAQENDNRSHNQPSHEAAVKGGQHSHDNNPGRGQQQQQSGNQGQQSGHNAPSHEASVKGGQHSHSGKES